MLLVPRRITFFIIGLVTGLAVGWTAGYNTGRGAPPFSNPFVRKKSVGDDIRRAGKRVGDAVEKGGRELKRLFDR